MQTGDLFVERAKELKLSGCIHCGTPVMLNRVLLESGVPYSTIDCPICGEVYSSPTKEEYRFISDWENRPTRKGENNMKCKICGCTRMIVELKANNYVARCADCNTYNGNLKQPQNIETGELASESQSNYAYSLMENCLKNNIQLTKRQAGNIINTLKGDV